MAVTDLLSAVPFPPAGDDSPAGGDGQADGWAHFSAPAEYVPPPPRRRPAPLPSWVVLALGGLSLSVLGLVALLLVGAEGLQAATADAAVPDATAEPLATAIADAPAATPAPEAAQTTFGAEPRPVPADQIARLEAASNEPLHDELAQLLAAIQTGFGTESAGLDPSLRSYTVRMASRFEWNPDTFRVSVAAPSPELAEARAATLRRIFGDAVASRRLQIQTATGPDALSLASR